MRLKTLTTSLESLLGINYIIEHASMIDNKEVIAWVDEFS